MIASTNPANGEPIARFDALTPSQTEQALQQAHSAQRAWARQPLAKRTELLRAVAQVLRANRDSYARLITLEMGKPLAEAQAEIDKCAWNCAFYAEAAADFIGDKPVASGATRSKVVFDPLGLVLAVMPWNYPFWQVLRFAAPALAAGNGAVLKHANNVPQCAQALQQAFKLAGAPEGLFTTLLVEAEQVKALIEDPRIAAVTLTGSTPVGKLVAAQAGAVLKKQVLELGGSDPFIVLADADVAAAAQMAAKARLHNAGQSCISAKRFIVEQAVADEFVHALCDASRQWVLGDPMQPSTTLGPMARHNLRDALHGQVRRTLAEGAELLLGGMLPEGRGAYYPATVLDHVTPQMAAGREETFGPVAAVLRVKDAQEAIAVANGTEFGLGAALWTRDLARADALARELEAGSVFVNGMVASDPRLPFGGIKQSGYGRELGSFGMHEFTNIKTVWIGPAI